MTSFHDSAVFSDTVYIQYIEFIKIRFLRTLQIMQIKVGLQHTLILENFSMYKHACIYRCDQK